MRHKDTICISDAGLAVPKDVELIDLAVVRGLPSFLDVLDAVLSELAVEQITITSEMQDISASLSDEVLVRFPDTDVMVISHEEFKCRTKDCVAVVRTGECTYYANIILKAAVAFTEE